MNENSNTNSLVPPLWILTLLALCACCWLLSELREIVTLLVVGYCIAFAIDPILDWLEEKQYSRTLAIGIIVGVLSLVAILLALTALPTLVEEYYHLVENLHEYILRLKENWLPKLKEILPASMHEQLQSSISGIMGGDFLKGVLGGTTNALLKGYSLTLTIVNLALLPFIVFYLALGIDKMHTDAFLLIPPRFQAKAKSIFTTISTDISAFIRGQILVASVLAILYAFSLGFLGVELWLLLAVVSGFGNVIPYLGLMIGIILSSIMALITFGDFTHVLYVWGIYGGIQFLEGTFITPKILGDKVGLSPLAIIIAIFAGGKLFGLVGIFLAVPGATVVRVLFNEFHVWLEAKVEAGEVEVVG